MSARVEVLTGAGSVIRFGDLAVWAGPQSSAQLIGFLYQSARNVAGSPESGRQVVDHVAGILGGRDPEPAAPFGVLGPTRTGWLLLLHGPIQAFDGTQWFAPQPHQGWLHVPVVPRPAITFGPAGSPPVRVVMESPYDLVAGMVPGGGMIVIPDVGAGLPAELSAGSAPAGMPAPGTETGLPVAIAGSVGLPAGGTGPVPESSFAPEPEPVPETGSAPDPERAPEAEPVPVTPSPTGPGTEEGALDAPPSGPASFGGPLGPAPSAPPSAGSRPAGRASAPRPEGVVELTDAGRATPSTPLPRGSAPTPAERPEILGVLCERGHLNRPGATQCAFCRRAVPPGAEETTGRRPTLGALLADDGSVFPLRGDVLLGSGPESDPAAEAGAVQPIRLSGGEGRLAPVHAELRLGNWGVTVVDRGSAAGTFVFDTGTGTWQQVDPYAPVELAPGGHISLGQRVLTYLSPWT